MKKLIRSITMTTRRKFFKSTLISGAALCLPDIVAAAMPVASKKRTTLNKNDIILFQGDSITDAGRNKEEKLPNVPWTLGSGYSLLASAQLLKKHSDKTLSIYNRGIGGNKVYQLKERWQTDCLDLKPAIVSIHIGVNDFWHTLTSGYKGTVETYEQDYRNLLTQTREALPGVKFIIGEPFAVLGVKSVTPGWFPTFDNYRAVSKKLAHEFDAIFIPYHDVFIKAQQHAPGIYWTEDGVHPTLAGSELMAEAWLQAID